MVQILLFTLLLSANISAFNFTKVSGSFENAEKKETLVGEQTLTEAASGKYELVSEADRSPASAEEVSSKKTETAQAN